MGGMSSELFSPIEKGLLKGKALSEQEENKVTAPGQARLELFFHKRYRLPERPDVEIERTVWAYRARGKRLAIVATV